MPCGWKTRGKRCGERDVAVRDLGPTYRKLHMQPVCQVHRDYIDAATRSRCRIPPADDPDRES
jgi:hypothetical protein